ncbi:NADH-quinone oxidoreductase subunit N [Nymphon striatum]|nr:NADH-quinone oxidoreductase subunit N [Nymphon striatum]
MPWTFGALVIGGLSLIGVPGTAGFISKWYLVLAALEQEAWIAVAVILIGSLLAVVYIGKIIETLYFKPVTPKNIDIKEAPMLLLVPTWILVFANIYFGLNTELTVGIAERAVQALGVLGEEFALTIAEPMPGVVIAFRIEALGMLFALVTGLLWIVTSIYAIGYMRSHQEKNQTRFYVAFAVSISCTLAIAFSENSVYAVPFL